MGKRDSTSKTGTTFEYRKTGVTFATPVPPEIFCTYDNGNCCQVL